MLASRLKCSIHLSALSRQFSVQCQLWSPKSVGNLLPKRPRSSFMRYKDEHFEAMRSQGFKVTEIAQKVGAMWSELSIIEKQKYELEFKSEFSDYKQKMLKLQENEEEWNNIMKQQKADKKAKMNKPQNKFIKQLKKDAPPRPLLGGPYMLYYLEHLEKGKATKEQMITLSKEWHQLPNSRKQEYEMKLRNVNKERETEYAKWEKRMAEEGHFGAIRKSNRKALKEMATEKL